MSNPLKLYRCNNEFRLVSKPTRPEVGYPDELIDVDCDEDEAAEADEAEEDVEWKLYVEEEEEEGGEGRLGD